jgi:uncharacterized protein YjiS (DUF1127 family)
MHKNCKETSCKELALSLSDYCWHHITDKRSYIARIEEYKKDGKSMAGFCFKGLHAASIDFSGADLKGANLSNAHLKGANFSDANLSDATFIGSNISECEFIGAECSRANFMMANLSKSRFWHADLRDADFAESDMHEADLLNASLSGSNLYHANLKDIKFLTKENFAGRNKKEYVNEQGPKTARESYANLKQYFITAARFNDVSWASYNESRMELRRMWKDRDLLGILPFGLIGLLCGWGERPLRATVAALSIITTYGITYFTLRTITSSAVESYIPTLIDCIYYSTVTFTTLGYGDFVPKSDPLFRLLAGSEAFIGIFMMGLFVFALGRRYSTR